MDWLTQNWIWIVLAIGAYFLFARLNVGGCAIGGCSMGHSMRNNESGNGPLNVRGAGSGTTFDPVNGHVVAAGASISSIYHDQAYYFESRENRDAFETDPEKYLATSPQAGRAIGSQQVSAVQSRRRSGCG